MPHVLQRSGQVAGNPGRGTTRLRAASRSRSLPGSVGQALSVPGHGLEPATQSLMELGFRHDFHAVRIHTDTRAAESAHDVGAQAYTIGRHIVFGAGQYAPRTPWGRTLIAHELRHTMQQRGGGGDEFELEAGRAEPEDESDARSAADSVARGEVAPPVSGGMAARPRLRRAEFGTYVSTVGDPTYLDAGAAFYRSWGHPNVKRVSAVEEVLTDLDRARGPIDRFRIVSHGSSAGIELKLLRELTPWFGTSEAGLVKQEPFRKLFAAFKLVDDGAFGRIVNLLRADTIAGPLLITLGVGKDTPGEVSNVGIVLRAIVDARFLSDVQLQGGGRPDIPNRGPLEQFNRDRLTTYRGVMVNEAPAAQKKDVGDAVDKLARRLPDVLSTAGWTFDALAADEAQALGGAVVEPAAGGRKARLQPEVTREIKEGAGGPYLKTLGSVRGKVDEKTHIEIRGCNVGSDTSVLDAFRAFFGRPGALPSISAPDIFQYFFRFSYQTFPGGPRGESDLRTAYDNPDTGLAAGFEEQVRTRAGEWIRTADEWSLAVVAAKYGLNAEMVRRLNPEIDPDHIPSSTALWLVPRTSVPAGRYGKLADFCRDYVGNEHAWPAVWAANPNIVDPSNLRPDLVLTVPATLLRSPIASSAPTFADLTREIRAGKPVVGLSSTENRPYLYMDDPGRAKALGDWLAAQKFDPTGPTAAALSRRYAGAGFSSAAAGTYIQFLSAGYPQIVDPIFPSDPRFDKHVIVRP